MTIPLYMEKVGVLDPSTYQLSSSAQNGNTHPLKSSENGWDFGGQPSIDLFASKGHQGKQSKAGNCAIICDIYIL